jgi:hypothetical protein
MARPGKARGKSGTPKRPIERKLAHEPAPSKRRIEQYDHKGKQRKNNSKSSMCSTAMSGNTDLTSSCDSRRERAGRLREVTDPADRGPQERGAHHDLVSLTRSAGIDAMVKRGLGEQPRARPPAAVPWSVFPRQRPPRRRQRRVRASADTASRGPRTSGTHCSSPLARRTRE